MKTQLSLFFILIFHFTSYTQSFPDTRTVVFQDSSKTIRAEIFIDEVEDMKHRTDAIYFSYYKNHLFETQAGNVGRLLHGDYKVFDENDRLATKGHFYYGMKHKKWSNWYENGKLKNTYNWRYGRKEGRYAEYNEKGQAQKKGKYKTDQLHGKVKYYEKGKLSKTEKYKHGILQKRSKKDTLNKDEILEPTPKKKQSKAKKKHTKKQKAPSTQKHHPKKIINNKQVESKKEKTPNLLVFINDAKTGRIISNASLKISAFDKQINEKKYLFFGKTDQDGKYLLKRDSGDYVLFVRHDGFDPQEVRIYDIEKRNSYAIHLNPTATCIQVQGKIKKGTYNIPLSGAEISIENNRGKILTKIKSDESGNFEYCLPCGQTYTVIVQKEYFSPEYQTIKTASDCLSPIKDAVVFYMKQKKEEQVERILAENNKEDLINEQGLTSKLAPTPPKRRTKSTSTTTQVTSRSKLLEEDDIEFYVIAGTFSTHKNAKKRLKKVQELGYDEAYIISYNTSDYFAVCLGRFPNREKAKSLAKKAKKTDEIKTYIKQL